MSAASIYIFLAAFETGILGIRIVSLDVPQTITLGREVRLNCAYDLEGDTLYSVKWYKDDVEFFRYVPTDNPEGQYFEVNGITVDMKKSNSTTVLIRGIESTTGGKYKCEVSADAPSFQTISAERKIWVNSSAGSHRQCSQKTGVLLAICSILLILQRHLTSTMLTK